MSVAEMTLTQFTKNKQITPNATAAQDMKPW